MPWRTRVRTARSAAEASGLAEALERGEDTPATRRWCDCMRLVGTGVRIPQALAQTGMSRRALRRYVRADGRLRAWFDHARRWGRRGNYSKLAIAEALAEVAQTDRSFRAALLPRGFTLSQYAKIARWAQTDPWVREAYERAKAAQRTRMIVSTKDEWWNTEITSGSRRTIARQFFEIDKLQPVRARRAKAAEYRAAQAQREPLKAALLAARRRARRAARVTSKTETTHERE